jgi:uncharacterized protein (TIGR02246 family)
MALADRPVILASQRLFLLGDPHPATRNLRGRNEEQIEGINESVMTSEYTRRLFTVVDAKDADGFAEFFAEDGVLRFGNAEPLQGRSAIQEAISRFFTTIKSLEHRIVNEWIHGDTTIIEAKVTYHRHDSKSVTIPAVTIYQQRDNMITDYRIYIDLAPLYAS